MAPKPRPCDALPASEKCGSCQNPQRKKKCSQRLVPETDQPGDDCCSSSSQIADCWLQRPRCFWNRASEKLRKCCRPARRAPSPSETGKPGRRSSPGAMHWSSAMRIKWQTACYLTQVTQGHSAAAALSFCWCAGKVDPPRAGSLEVLSLLAAHCDVRAAAGPARWLRGPKSSLWLAPDSNSGSERTTRSSSSGYTSRCPT